MRKISLLFVVLVLASTIKGYGQLNKPLVAVVKTPQAWCIECKEKIEKFMKYEEGVAKVVVDIKKQTTTVTYLKDRTNIENIKTAIANLGFDADDITANEEYYKRLPQCCKRESDGGGPPKKKQSLK